MSYSHRLIESGNNLCVCFLCNTQHSFLRFGHAQYMFAEWTDKMRGPLGGVEITGWAVDQGGEGTVRVKRGLLAMISGLSYSARRGVTAESEGTETPCSTETLIIQFFSHKDQALDEWMDRPHLSAPWSMVFLRRYRGAWLWFSNYLPFLEQQRHLRASEPWWWQIRK